MTKLHLVAKQTPEDERAYQAAVIDGCKPRWYDGILGWAWHCTCADKDHACNQQCSVLETYREEVSQ